jgi:hypothetical protein
VLWWNSNPGSSVLHLGFLHGHHLQNRKEVKGQLGIITELFWADSRRINGGRRKSRGVNGGEEENVEDRDSESRFSPGW